MEENKITPNFDFDKYKIGIDDIKKEANKQAEIVNSTNQFPVHIFPLQVQKIIRATNESLNFPVDFIGASMLYAVSVAIGNTHKVEVKRGWLESSVLYLAIVSRPGTNKSHPLSFALQPIIEHDKVAYRQYDQDRIEYERQFIHSKKEKETNSVIESIKPFWQKFLLSDFTPEALAEVHKYNKRGIGVYVDELAGWFKNFNRYNKGSEMEFWLSVWSGKPINIDRKSGEPIFIPLPFISVCGTIQNGILNELAKDSRMQNGFIDRILFVIPENLQKEYWSDTELGVDIHESWQTIVSNILELSISKDETDTPCPKILRFNPDAKQLLFKWQKTNTDESNDAQNDAVSGIYSKLEMYAIRLALILQMMMYSCDESDKDEIGVQAVEGALKLIEYFKQSAIKVHSIISGFNPLHNYPTDKQVLYAALPDTFSTEAGLNVAKSLGIPERTFKRFLRDRELFVSTSRGEYRKL